MPEADGIAYDPLALDATERRFWGELWRAAPPALAAEHGIEVHAFGPLQATLVRDLAPVRAMNLVLGEPVGAATLLHRRVRDAAAAGCRTLLVETGERTEDRPSASYRNILRAGFREAYVRPNWVVQRG